MLPCPSQTNTEMQNYLSIASDIHTKTVYEGIKLHN